MFMCDRRRVQRFWSLISAAIVIDPPSELPKISLWELGPAPVSMLNPVLSMPESKANSLGVRKAGIPIISFQICTSTFTQSRQRIVIEEKCFDFIFKRRGLYEIP